VLLDLRAIYASVLIDHLLGLRPGLGDFPCRASDLTTIAAISGASGLSGKRRSPSRARIVRKYIVVGVLRLRSRSMSSDSSSNLGFAVAAFLGQDGASAEPRRPRLAGGVALARG